MRHIDKYEITGLLGRGGMGHVYKVRIPHVGKTVALKLLKPVEHMLDLMGKDALKEQFLHEARLMAGIRHPHVAQIWDYGEHQGWPYFTMEYACENLGAAIGESYRVEAPTRRLWPDKAVRYTLQTLDALARLHYAGIVHRDLKPFNLLLDSADQVKLIDFGLSKLRGEQAEFLANPAAMPKNMKVGTPYYTAPEQERDPESADARADTYAAGVLLYRLLTGLLPQEGGLAQDDEVFTAPTPPAMSASWEAFFRKALAPAPDKRFASALAMRNELQELYALWKQDMKQACGLPQELLDELADGDTDDNPDDNANDNADDAPGKGRNPCPIPMAKGARAFPLRHWPLKTGPISASKAFGLDELARPPQTASGAFTPVQGAPQLLHHTNANLLWQREGSPYPCTWQQAWDYVRSLNATAYAGRSNWRLPTVEELVTLVRSPEEENAQCMPSLFTPDQRLLWTADRRSFMAAWIFNASLGFVGWQDFTCPAWIRAVATEETP